MIITFGEIMLRFTPKNISERINQAIDFTVEPGGSESNVAIALSNLGLKTCFITKLPENQLSKKIIQYLNQFSINTEFIKIKGSKVGIYWTENGIGPRNSFVIYDRENSSFINIEKDDFDWENIFKNSIWFHFSGISPALSEKVFDVLINALEINKSPVSVDLNFRQKLWNWAEKDKEKIFEKMKKLCSYATLIAGNETDFQNIFGLNSMEKNDDKHYSDIAKQCQKIFPKANYIAISNRKSLSASINIWSGYLFVKNEKKYIYKGPKYKLDNIIDRIGTGDSFVAGIIFGLVQKNIFPYQTIINLAVCLSALNHTTKGDASRFSLNEVFKVLESKGSGKIIR